MRKLIPLLLLGALFLANACFASPFSTADSLAVEALVDSAEKYQQTLPDKALEFAEEAERMSIRSGYRLGKLRALNQMADVWMNGGQLGQAEDMLLRCLALADSLGRQTAVAALQDKLGTLNRKLGNYPEALAYHQRAKLVFDSLQNVNGTAVCLNNMAIISKYMGDLDGAMAQYREAAEICKASGAPLRLTAMESNMAQLFMDQNEMDSAEHYIRKVLDTTRARRFVDREAEALNILGGVLQKRGDLQAALEAFAASRAIAEQRNNRFLLTGLRVREGDVLFKLGRRGEARRALEEGRDMARQLGAPEIQKTALHLLYRLSEEEGRYREALGHFKLARTLQDSLVGAETQREVALIREQYAFERKERELAELNLQLEREVLARQAQALDLAESRSRIWLLVAVAAVLGLVAVFGLGRYVNGRRRARLLEEKQAVTAQALEEKELLLGEIHHRVKNNLQVIYNMLDLQARGLEDGAARAALAESMNRVGSMALIHQELYREGNVEAVKMPDYLRRLAAHVRASFGGEDSGVECRVEVEDMLLDLNSAIPMGMLVNELLANAFKHAFGTSPGGRILLSLREEGASLLLEVADNGRGRAGAIDAEGFGTRLLRSLARQLRAEIVEHSGEGLRVLLKINKYKRLDNG